MWSSKAWNQSSLWAYSQQCYSYVVLHYCQNTQCFDTLLVGYQERCLLAKKALASYCKGFFRTFRKANKAVFSWIIVIRAVCLCVADRFRSLWQSQQCLHHQFCRQSRSTPTSPRCSNLQPALHPGLHSNLGSRGKRASSKRMLPRRHSLLLMDRCYLRPVSDDLVFSHIAFH